MGKPAYQQQVTSSASRDQQSLGKKSRTPTTTTRSKVPARSKPSASPERLCTRLQEVEQSTETFVALTPGLAARRNDLLADLKEVGDLCRKQLEKHRAKIWRSPGVQSEAAGDDTMQAARSAIDHYVETVGAKAIARYDQMFELAFAGNQGGAHGVARFVGQIVRSALVENWEPADALRPVAFGQPRGFLPTWLSLEDLETYVNQVVKPAVLSRLDSHVERVLNEATVREELAKTAPAGEPKQAAELKGQPAPSLPRLQHSADYRTLVLPTCGRRLHLTKQQAAVIRVLAEAATGPGPVAVSKRALASAAGCSNAGRIWDSFRTKNGRIARKELVEDLDKGFYRLKQPSV